LAVLAMPVVIFIKSDRITIGRYFSTIQWYWKKSEKAPSAEL